MQPVNKTQIIIGMAALLLGLTVYLGGRPPDSNYLLQAMGDTPLSGRFPAAFAFIGGQVPSFIHVFSFTLLTAGLLGCSARGALAAGLFWTVVNILFEIGQMAGAGTADGHPGAFATGWGLPVLNPYFRYGTYDPLDMAAVFIGAIAALVIWRITTRRSAPS